MPQVFKIGPYWVVLLGKRERPVGAGSRPCGRGAPSANATKVWITKAGKCLLCNNNSQIPERVLRNILRIIEARSAEVIEKWMGFFGEVSYYC